MALMMGSLRDALVEAGASPDSATKAAEEAARNDSQLVEVKSTLKLHSWMLTLVIAFQAGMVWQMFNLSADVAGLSSTVAGLASTLAGLK